MKSFFFFIQDLQAAGATFIIRQAKSFSPLTSLPIETSPLTPKMRGSPSCTCLAPACLSVCVRVSQVKGFEKMAWTGDTATHPPWLRFHLGISRWELYDRKNPNLTILTQHLATQRILGAGEPGRRGRGSTGRSLECADFCWR